MWSNALGRRRRVLHQPARAERHRGSAARLPPTRGLLVDGHPRARAHAADTKNAGNVGAGAGGSRGAGSTPRVPARTRRECSLTRGMVGQAPSIGVHIRRGDACWPDVSLLTVGGATANRRCYGTGMCLSRCDACVRRWCHRIRETYKADI